MLSIRLHHRPGSEGSVHTVARSECLCVCAPVRERVKRQYDLEGSLPRVPTDGHVRRWKGKPLVFKPFSDYFVVLLVALLFTSDYQRAFEVS